ncbi:MAG: ADP-ribosylglycohydrolase family protein [Armatimonadota bacterium]|nr:ADP-ribosylglycohydrolase family protein [Armatimonadota bacterium]
METEQRRGGTPRKEQFSGCLVGQCLGDALGAPVEGFPPSVCRQYVDRNLKAGNLKDFDRHLLSFGQYTDDSQLARELLESYVAAGHFDPCDFAQRIAAIFAEGRIVRPGRATSQAALRLRQGVAWDEAGTLPPSARNGSAMRAAPIGLFFFDNPEELVSAAQDQGRITHKDERCSAGAVAIAGAVALALQNDAVKVPYFLSQLSHWTSTIEPSVATGLRQLIEWVSLPPEEAAGIVCRVGLDPETAEEGNGISPFVTCSVLWSLYSFLRTPEDYWQTICTAIAVGGDVDTTAAMAGAISGAHLGLEAIPQNLASRLTDQGAWALEQLVELAHRAYEIKMQQVRTN